MKLRLVSISAITAAFLVSQACSKKVSIDLHTALDNIHNRAPNEIWVSATRGDGKGKGTQVDPFDGSTPTKLDQLLNSYYTAGTENLHVHLGPGTFQTRVLPENGWHPRSGWTIEGAGIGTTVLQAAPANLAGVHYDLEIIKSDFKNAVNGVTIKDLTLDCNWTVLAPTADAGAGSYTVNDAHTTNGSAILTSASANHALGFDVSHFSRSVTGTGIPANTTILRIPSTTVAAASDDVSFPQAIINVADTIDFAMAGTFGVIVDDGSFQTITYSGKTSISFTGCTGGAGKISVNNRVTTLTQTVMSANATATNNSASITIGGEKNTKVQGFSLMGSNNTVGRVRCINAYGSFANGQEAFVIRLESFCVIGTSLDASNDVIKDCVVEQFLGNYGSPYSIAGDYPGGHPLTNSAVKGCLARGRNTGNQNEGFNTGGVNAGGLKDCEILDNTFIDCFGIYYQDTDASDGIRIANNTAIRASGGVWFVMDGAGAWTKKNILIAGNKISVQNRNGDNANVPIWFANARSTNVSIVDNDFHYDGSGNGSNTGMEGVRLHAIDGGQLSNNRWAENASFTISGDVVNFAQRNNRKFSGASIQSPQW
jgi:hypothetical protein